MQSYNAVTHFTYPGPDTYFALKRALINQCQYTPPDAGAKRQSVCLVKNREDKNVET